MDWERLPRKLASEERAHEVGGCDVARVTDVTMRDALTTVKQIDTRIAVSLSKKNSKNPLALYLVADVLRRPRASRNISVAFCHILIQVGGGSAPGARVATGPISKKSKIMGFHSLPPSVATVWFSVVSVSVRTSSGSFSRIGDAARGIRLLIPSNKY